MNRFLKIFLKAVLGIVIFMILASSFFYWYVSTQWKKYYTENEIKEYVKIINNSPAYSSNLYAIYDKLYNNDRHKSITRFYIEAIWDEIILKEYQDKNCWFVDAADDFALLKAKKRERFQGFILAWGLEKFTTSEKCFDYCLYEQNKEFRNDFNDSIIHDISKLENTQDILEYIAITEAPSRYQRNPDLLLKRTEELRKRLY